MQGNFKFDPDTVIEAVASDECLGFCTSCGDEARSVEPDARDYTCVACDRPDVYGAEEILMGML